MPDGIFSTGTVTFTRTEGSFSGSGNISAARYQRAPAPPNPSPGPAVPYVYLNSAGTFKLSTGNSPGAAQYVWQGVQNNDTLNLVGFGYVEDNTEIGLPSNSRVDAWLYMASDVSGNVWYLAFGVDPLQLPGTPCYPLYYSYNNPSNPSSGGNLKRWLTPSGTTRL